MTNQDSCKPFRGKDLRPFVLIYNIYIYPIYFSLPYLTTKLPILRILTFFLVRGVYLYREAKSRRTIGNSPGDFDRNRKPEFGRYRQIVFKASGFAYNERSGSNPREEPIGQRSCVYDTSYRHQGIWCRLPGDPPENGLSGRNTKNKVKEG